MVDIFRRLAKRRRERMVIAASGNCSHALISRIPEENRTRTDKAEEFADAVQGSVAEVQSLRRVLAQPFCIVTEILCLLFVGVVVMAHSYTNDAALFPTVVGALGISLCAVFLVTAILEPDFVARNIGDMEQVADKPRGFWVAFISSPLYCLAIDIVGFDVATFIAVVWMPFLLGYRAYLRLIVVALAAVVVLHLVFVSAVQIDLPDGLLGDYILQRFVYQP